MNEKIFEILEYDRIKQMLEKFATSSPGCQMCRQLMPETEIEKITKLMDETSAKSLKRIFSYANSQMDISFTKMMYFTELST